mmetsp:Transcript_41759/g.75815  ORF Transcript_41759/g.75815 Transcript_41759/m.75815 type:complete len:146 (+) Transcript_41759:72-509(+)
MRCRRGTVLGFLVLAATLLSHCGYGFCRSALRGHIRVPSGVQRNSQVQPKEGAAVPAEASADPATPPAPVPADSKPAKDEEEEPDMFMLDILEYASYAFWGAIILWASGSTAIAVFSGEVRDSDGGSFTPLDFLDNIVRYRDAGW